MHGDLGAVEGLLARWQFNPNILNNRNMAPLHIAAFFGMLDVMDCLLSHHGFEPSLDVDLQSRMGTPLDIAIDNASGVHFHVVERLCRDERVVLDQTRLELAIFSRDVQWAKSIIEGGKCDVNEFFPSLGLAPIHLAVFCEMSEIVEALINVKEVNVNAVTSRALLDNHGITPLEIAISRRQHNIISLLLLSSTIDPNIHTPLKKAIEIGDVKTVKMLLQDKRLSPGKNFSQSDALRAAMGSAERLALVDAILEVDRSDVRFVILLSCL